MDLRAALAYPLSVIPLSLATVDEKRTSNSKLIVLLAQKVALKDLKTYNSVKEIKRMSFL